VSDTQADIRDVCNEVALLLMEKNRKYGDSALNPCRIFSIADCEEQLRVRIDDKLSRIAQAEGDEDEDVIIDLIGYLVLLLIAQRRGALP